MKLPAIGKSNGAGPSLFAESAPFFPIMPPDCSQSRAEGHAENEALEKSIAPTVKKTTGNGNTDYEVTDWHGRRGSIRLDHGDGTVQFTPSAEGRIGTLWFSPADNPEIYAEIFRFMFCHLQQGPIPSDSIEESIFGTPEERRQIERDHGPMVRMNGKPPDNNLQEVGLR